MSASEGDRYKSIEWSILEDAVEGSRPSLWNVIQLLGYDHPALDEARRIQAARELVQRMIDANLISLMRTTAKGEWEPVPPLSRDAAWEAGRDAELRKCIIVATPKGEAAYLAH
jgi:hypothetical protein